MSWASTLQYYRRINTLINKSRGRQYSAPLVVTSVNFQDIIDAQTRDDWQAAGQILEDCARGLAATGCGTFLIASNTMHKVYEQVMQSVNIPGINIFDVTAAAIKESKYKKIALLGTRYTMYDPFFREAYKSREIDIIVPESKDAHAINMIIFKELIHDKISYESKNVCHDIIGRLINKGVEGIILGCTELESIFIENEASITMFNTAELHANAAAKWLLNH